MASVTVGGAPCWALLPLGLGLLGLNVIEDVLGGRVRAAVEAPGLGLGLALTAGCGRSAPTSLGGRLAAVLGFGRVAGAALVRACALAAAGLLAVGTGLRARLGGSLRGLGGGVLDEDVVVVVMDEVVVVVEVYGVGGGGEGCGGRQSVLGCGCGRGMLGPASSENKGVG